MFYISIYIGPHSNKTIDAAAAADAAAGPAG